MRRLEPFIYLLVFLKLFIPLHSGPHIIVLTLLFSKFLRFPFLFSFSFLALKTSVSTHLQRLTSIEVYFIKITKTNFFCIHSNCFSTIHVCNAEFTLVCTFELKLSGLSANMSSIGRWGRVSQPDLIEWVCQPKRTCPVGNVIGWRALGCPDWLVCFSLPMLSIFAMWTASSYSC